MSDESLDAFFTLSGETPEIPDEIERDQWGRPLILQPDGSRVAYTRASSLANNIENRFGLHKWDVRQVVRGMGLLEDVAAMAASLPSATGDKRKDGISNKALDEYADLAREAARVHKEANYGTAVHGFTAPGMRGNPHVPQRMQADVDSYWDQMDTYDLQVVASEVFIVNDTLKCAGTFDRLYWADGFGLVVGDEKTGKARIKSTLIQMSVYARGAVYDWNTGARYPIASLVDWNQLGFGQPAVDKINEDWTFFVHIPAGEGRTIFYKADQHKGWEAARVAAWVRDWNQLKEGLVWDAHNDLLAGRRERMAYEAILQCGSRDELIAVATAFRDVWTDRLTQLGREHMAGMSMP